MYAWVVAMLRCPASEASTRTLTPLLAKVVMNVLLQEWLLAPSMPACRYSQWKFWQSVLPLKPSRFCVRNSGSSGSRRLSVLQ